ncbi:MAG: tetratricopeptide repeat protein [Candidatus Aminicenantes bacterium]|nr:tetratricopeptide repeat protein [Candidatus Aminicenantes bacterium]
MRSFMTVPLVLLSLALALSAQDDLGRGRISGEIVDESGAKILDALVVVESPRSSTRLETKTDKKGHFAVGGLGTGAWRVTASKEGYLSAATEVQVSQIKANPPVSLTLKRAAGSEASPSAEIGGDLLDRGNALLKEGRYDEALAAFEEFAAKFPDIYVVRLNIGSVYMEKGDLDRAEAEFRAVLDKNGPALEDLRKQKDTSLKALSGLGEVALKRSDFETAQGFFRRGLEISPEDPAAAYNVGEIFFSNQKIDESIVYLELAVKIKSDWPKAYHRLGLAYLNKGDFPKALANLKKFLELDPQSPDAAGVKAAIAAIEQIKK